MMNEMVSTIVWGAVAAVAILGFFGFLIATAIADGKVEQRSTPLPRVPEWSVNWVDGDKEDGK